ncbi:MAG TPA: G8 domain-containing protein, partial [Planctomycetota bacterium]|nr:G8 domain-containing protein [Planctomycetota bacterium]
MSRSAGRFLVTSILISSALGAALAGEGDEPKVADGKSVLAITVRSARSGAWSDAGTWAPGRAPASHDRVRIEPGHEVVYDARSDNVIDFLHVAGTLRFARDRDTRLTVGLLRVDPIVDEKPEGSGVEDVHDHHEGHPSGPEAVLEVGTPIAPIPHPYKAEIRLAYVDGHSQDSSPAIICRPGGRMELHGAPMSRTWIDLGADAKKGDERVALDEDVTGWRAGDTVIITGSEHRSSNAIGGFRGNVHRLETEERRISSIEGRTIVLDRPLEHDHAGTGPHRSEIANLSRTVVIESADPAGVRGHTMFHVHSAGAISYARFAHLGKEGVLGRYPIHFHRVRSTMRGSSVVGAAIVDSHNRWLTIH